MIEKLEPKRNLRGNIVVNFMEVVDKVNEIIEEMDKLHQLVNEIHNDVINLKRLHKWELK